jgi:hypothetical protein
MQKPRQQFKHSSNHEFSMQADLISIQSRKKAYGLCQLRAAARTYRQTELARTIFLKQAEFVRRILKQAEF